MADDVRITIRICSAPLQASPRIGCPRTQEYTSRDGLYLLQLQKDSEIRFGPSFYKAAIFGGDGGLTLNFGSRRFFSYDRHAEDFPEQPSPWSPTSPCVVLLEMLSRRSPPGSKVTRIIFLDAAGRVPVKSWAFDSLISHRMWSADGNFYLFRDVREIYLFSYQERKLISILNSDSPHCFLMKDHLVCAVEWSGLLQVFDAHSGKRLATDTISEPGCSLKSAIVNAEQRAISLTLQAEGGRDTRQRFYAVTVERVS